MWKSAGRAPSLRVFTLAFALQLREKHGKTSVRVRETSVRLIKTSVREYDGEVSGHDIFEVMPFVGSDWRKPETRT
jgi:hypothetical protein